MQGDRSRQINATPPDSGRYWKGMVRSPSHEKLSACVQPIEAAIMRHGCTWISSIGAVPNYITKNLTDESTQRASCATLPRAQKRRISDIMSDRSLSS